LSIAGVPNSLMSAPAENVPVLPISTIARTAASATARSSASTSSSLSEWLRLFTGGFANARTATPSHSE
jgi:hypothetical protein